MLSAVAASAVLVILLLEQPPAAEEKHSAPPAVRPPIFAAATTQYPTREWMRPATAPNGERWPEASGYLAGYRLGRRAGSSSVTVDARNQRSDTLVRFYDVAGGYEVAVRTAFVAAGDSFTLANVAPGTYELRCRDLDSGAFTRSQRFEVGGNNASDVTIVLHKVRSPKLVSRTSAELAFADALEPDLFTD